MHLPATDLLATYRVLSTFQLPHHSGSLIRGVLGRALRRTACAASTPCAAQCDRPLACAYSRLFDPPVPDPLPHELLRGSTHAPQPLLPLIPSPGTLELRAGEAFELGVRVLGPLDPAERERLVQALAGLAELPWGRDHGRLATDCVTHRPTPAPSEPPPTAPRHATLTLQTPAWLEQRVTANGKAKTELLRTPDFRTLFRHLHRRVTILCALYGQLPPDDKAHFAQLDARCDEVTLHASLTPLRWERHSLERDERHPMKGLLGRITLHGELAPFVPTLRLAELGHVGKATSHGLGRIRLELA